MPERFATAEGTARYANRLGGQVEDGNFRNAGGLLLTSIGLGTYLGRETDEDDASYAEAVITALRLGANLLDTAINYRAQRSERVIGQALVAVFREGILARDEVVIATKGGFLPFDGTPPSSRDELLAYLRRTFVEPGILAPADLVAGVHSIAPGYLRHQLGQSLANLGLEAIDVYYLHNPEHQLAEVSRDEFARRIRAAFVVLEEAVEKERIRSYGVATWNGFRVRPNVRDYLSLHELVQIARSIAGDRHHFRFAQLPYNLAMHEAFTLGNQELPGNAGSEWHSVLEAAARLGITVVASASILQGRLTRALPEALSAAFPGLVSDACRALQFVRSTPGVTTALVGMRNASHVRENLTLAARPRSAPGALMKLFEKA